MWTPDQELGDAYGDLYATGGRVGRVWSQGGGVWGAMVRSAWVGATWRGPKVFASRDAARGWVENTEV